MKLFIGRYDDYRTGTEYIISDIDDILLEMDAISAPCDSNEENSKGDDAKKENARGKMLCLKVGRRSFDVIEIRNNSDDNDYLWLVCSNGYYDNTMIPIKKICDKNKRKEVLKDMYIYLNGHQEFVTTGLTAGYKETCYYPSSQGIKTDFLHR